MRAGRMSLLKNKDEAKHEKANSCAATPTSSTPRAEARVSVRLHGLAIIPVTLTQCTSVTAQRRFVVAAD